MDLLLDHGADVTLRNHEGQTAVEVASPQLRQRLLGAVDRGGVQHNLLQAAWQGRPDMVARILVSIISYASNSYYPGDTRRRINVGLTLVQRCRQWPNIKPAFIQRLVSAW